MSYRHALVARRDALAASRAARAGLDATVVDVGAAYRAHPVATLAGVATLGFVLAQLRIGSGLVHAGARIASGPAWRLVRQVIRGLE